MTSTPNGDGDGARQWPFESTEVVICGCGPTGAMLSALLNQMEVPNICLEKGAAIATDPRGIALDEDGIRALQSVGIGHEIYSEIGQCMGIFHFVGGVHNDLYRAPFMRIDYRTSEGGTGHVGFLCHRQPIMEKHLRRKMATGKFSELRSSCTLTSVNEDQDYVYVKYEDSMGSERQLRGRFLVGADGKTGYVRKKYLEPKGIVMERVSKFHYEETWVAMNFHLTLPTPDTHPSFPLWKLGYTPEQVYDRFFPPDFRFLCNPDRPAICSRFGVPRDRLWRFEYVVQLGEDGKEMASVEKIKGLVYPYLKHPGKWYGLVDDVAYPEDCIELLRASPFLFSARSCNKWALGRVILCGDAAHVFPPFGGQGIASGFRDALGLGWRLRTACKLLPQAYPILFESWYIERKQQLERSLAATVANGRYVTESIPIRIWLRDLYLSIIQLIPSWRRWLEQGPRSAGMLRYTAQRGVACFTNIGGGLLLPQIYCCSLDGGEVQLSDDVVFAPGKRGLFQLIVNAQAVDEVPELITQLDSLDIPTLSDNFLELGESTVIIHDLAARWGDEHKLSRPDTTVVRIALAAEFASSPLCENRPEPLYYTPQRLLQEVHGDKFIVVRPDRFTFATCATIDDLRLVLRSIKPILSGEAAC